MLISGVTDFKRYCKEQSAQRGIYAMPKRVRRAAVGEMYRNAQDVWNRYERNNFDIKKTLEQFGFIDDGTQVEPFAALYGVVLLRSAKIKVHG